MLFDKIASVYFIWKIYFYYSIGKLETASPVNRHCANCIGPLSFPIRRRTRYRPDWAKRHAPRIAATSGRRAATEACELYSQRAYGFLLVFYSNHSCEMRRFELYRGMGQGDKHTQTDRQTNRSIDYPPPCGRRRNTEFLYQRETEPSLGDITDLRARSQSDFSCCNYNFKGGKYKADC